MIGTGGAILGLALFLNGYYTLHYVLDPNDPEKTIGNEDIGNFLQIFIYVLYVLTAIYFLTVLCLWKDIAVSVSVLKTSAVIILGNMRVLLVPAFATLTIFTFVFGWGVALCYLLSRANIHYPSEADKT